MRSILHLKGFCTKIAWSLAHAGDLLHFPSGLSPPQLVDISNLGLNIKIKKFSYFSFAERGYSPPFGGE